MKYFPGQRFVCKKEEQKFELMTTILVEENLRFNWVYVYLGKRKEWVRDTILIVKIHKYQVLSLESRIENAIPKLQSIFGPIISKSPLQSIIARLFLKQTDCREEIDITEEIEMDPKDSFTTSIINGDYISSPSFITWENQV